MNQTRVFIDVHRGDETSETISVTNRDVLLGSGADATVNVPCDVPFLFTIIRLDPTSGKTYFQFTETMHGTLEFAGVKVSLSDLKREGAERALSIGLWIVELPSNATASIDLFNDAMQLYTITFRVRSADASCAEHAA